MLFTRCPKNHVFINSLHASSHADTASQRGGHTPNTLIVTHSPTTYNPEPSSSNANTINGVVIGLMMMCLIILSAHLSGRLAACSRSFLTAIDCAQTTVVYTLSHWVKILMFMMLTDQCYAFDCFLRSDGRRHSARPQRGVTRGLCFERVCGKEGRFLQSIYRLVLSKQ